MPTAVKLKRRTTQLRKSVNEQLLDRAVQHSIYLERYTKAEVNKIARLMNGKVIPDMVEDVEKRLKNIGQRHFRLVSEPERVRRLQQALAATDEQLRVALRSVSKDVRASMQALAITEAEFTERALRETVPFVYDFITPSPRKLRAIVNSRPMEGRLLKEWFDDLTPASQRRVKSAIQSGMVRGQNPRVIARDVRRQLNITTRQAQTITRTAVTHTSNHAREETYVENKSMVKQVQYVATLDTRTSDICISLDGKVFNVGEGPRPPMHHQCRSTTVPVLRSAEELGITGLPPLERRAMNGIVPAKTTYADWIKKQPASIQNKALGKTRAELLRAGKLDPARLVDPKTLKPLSLDQLRKKEGLSVKKKSR